MRPKWMAAALAATAFMLTTGAAVPAGSTAPFEVRLVTMNGRQGLAYYSLPARSFRFITDDSTPDERFAGTFQAGEKRP